MSWTFGDNFKRTSRLALLCVLGLFDIKMIVMLALMVQNQHATGQGWGPVIFVVLATLAVCGASLGVCFRLGERRRTSLGREASKW